MSLFLRRKTWKVFFFPFFLAEHFQGLEVNVSSLSARVIWLVGVPSALSGGGAQ